MCAQIDESSSNGRRAAGPALTPGRYGDAVTAGRTRAGRGRLLKAQRLDVLLAMGLAGLVNAAMLVIAAQLFTGGEQADSLEAVHAGLGDQLGTGASIAFALALLASGFASSSVGTRAVPLLWLTSRKDLMGGWVNRPVTTIVGAVVAALIIALNAHLLIGFVS